MPCQPAGLRSPVDNSLDGSLVTDTTYRRSQGHQAPGHVHVPLARQGQG